MDTPSFVDGLGRRFAVTGADGERLETLYLCAEIPATPQVQAALVESVSTLTHFHHESFAPVMRVERHAGVLTVSSRAVAGVRLSDLLRESERRMAGRDLDAALHLLKQLAAALAVLHERGADAAHGAIGPERVVVRADGTAVLVEGVLGRALEGLEYSRSQLWALFRVPAPATAGAVRLDQQADVLQLGVLALALMLGRVLTREEFPHALPTVLDEAASPDAGRAFPGVSRPLRAWIGRALQLERRIAFRNAADAGRALAAAVAEDASCRPSPAAVQRFLAGCSFEALVAPAAMPAQLRSRPGAVVIVNPVPPDRGSGAYRVSRQQMPPATATREVLADVTPAAPWPEPPGRADAFQHAGESRRGGARGNWLSRLLGDKA